VAEDPRCPFSPGTILECAGRTRLRVKRAPTKEELETMFGPDIAFLWDVYALCDPKELTDEAKDLHILARAIFEEVLDGPGNAS
jgi:hypothetical protein